MTCIAAIEHDGKVYMGGDSAASDQVTSYLQDQPKVFQSGQMLFGYTASFRLGQILEYHLRAPTVPAGPATKDTFRYMVQQFIPALRACLREHWHSDEEKSGSWEFLVGFNGTVYMVQSDFHVERCSHGFNAVGIGERVARGSLYSTAQLGVSPEQRIDLALRAAADLVPGVRPPFTILSL